MKSLHDPEMRQQFEARVRALSVAAKPRWGRMSVGQMLWHVNEAMAVAIGEKSAARRRVPLPAAAKFLFLRIPFPKNAPTLPEFVATGVYDLETERTRCLRLMHALAGRPLGAPWPSSPIFGAVTGDDVSRLQAKHLDHHLKQFGV